MENPSQDPASDNTSMQKRHRRLIIAGVSLGVFLVAIGALGYLVLHLSTPQKHQKRLHIPVTDPRSVPMATEKFISLNQAFTGTIVSVATSSASLRVAAAIADVAKTGQEVVPNKLSSKKVVYNVHIATSTVMQGGTENELKDGITITVVLPNGQDIYASTTVSAARIVIKKPAGVTVSDVVGNTHILQGVVRSKKAGTTNAVLVVGVRVVDAAKLKSVDLSGSFVTPYIEKDYTVIVPRSLDVADVHASSTVTVSTQEDIYSTTTVHAQSISVATIS